VFLEETTMSLYAVVRPWKEGVVKASHKDIQVGKIRQAGDRKILYTKSGGEKITYNSVGSVPS
jgi:hypothetical protein